MIADALKAYLRAISRIPGLSPEEEKELAVRIKRDGDEAALRQLVEGNLRFVVSYAKRYRGLGVPFLDLIHEEGLGRGVDRFILIATRTMTTGRSATMLRPTASPSAVAGPSRSSVATTHQSIDCSAP